MTILPFTTLARAALIDGSMAPARMPSLVVADRLGPRLAGQEGAPRLVTLGVDFRHWLPPSGDLHPAARHTAHVVLAVECATTVQDRDHLDVRKGGLPVRGFTHYHSRERMSVRGTLAEGGAPLWVSGSARSEESPTCPH